MSPYSIVYVLTNPAMPGLVKIGWTASEDAAVRIAQLYSTGVPFPFKREFACRVQNAEEVERAMHRAFAPNRVNPKREFFSIEPDQAIAILKLLHVEEVSHELDANPSQIAEQEIEAGASYASRRPNLNFIEMGIPVGSTLSFVEGDTAAEVISARKVRLNDDEMSLSAATRKLLNLDYKVNPGPYWLFRGRSLRDIYNETYPANG